MIKVENFIQIHNWIQQKVDFHYCHSIPINPDETSFRAIRLLKKAKMIAWKIQLEDLRRINILKNKMKSYTSKYKPKVVMWGFYGLYTRNVDFIDESAVE